MMRPLTSSSHAMSLVLALSLIACGDRGGHTAGAGGAGDAGSGGESSSAPSGGPGSSGASTTTSAATSSGQGTGGDGATGTGGSGSAGGGTGGSGGLLPEGPAPVLLGPAGNFVILAKSAITNVPTSNVTGDLGLSPAAASYITELSMTRVGTYWTSAQVTGFIFAADNDAPTPSVLTSAVSAMEAAYTDAATRPTPDFLDIGQGGAIGSLSLKPGLYRWNSTVTVPENVVLVGAPNDVWILQVTGDLEMSSARSMTLQGGALAKNIFWQVAGQVVIGTGAHAEGVVLSATAITMQTGSSINGRLLAQTAVNLASSTIAPPAE